MPKKRHYTEEIIYQLRRADVLFSRGATVSHLPARARSFVCVAGPWIWLDGAPTVVGVFVPAWSRIEPGAVADAAVCRSLPLLAEQEL